MNNVNNDECHAQNGEFTCGQKERMKFQWELYRDGMPVCEEGEMEVDILIKFAQEASGVFTDDFTLATADGDVFYNSISDYNSAFAPFGWTVVIALCLPNADYTFTYNSASGDGFGDDETAFLVVIRSDEEIAVVQGDFGDEAVIDIPMDPNITPMPPTPEPPEPTPPPVIPPTAPPPTPPPVVPPTEPPPVIPPTPVPPTAPTAPTPPADTPPPTPKPTVGSTPPPAPKPPKPPSKGQTKTGYGTRPAQPKPISPAAKTGYGALAGKGKGGAGVLPRTWLTGKGGR